MTIPGDFKELYRKFSNTELLDILENPGNYQPTAVEAAQAEFDLRNLTETEIEEARKPLMDKQIQEEKRKEKFQTVENNVRQVGGRIIETMSPMKSANITDHRIISIFVLVFGCFSIYQIFGDFKMHIDNLQEMRRIPSLLISYYFPLLVLPLSVFEFWRRRKIGWILLAVFLTFSTTNLIFIFVYLLQHLFVENPASTLFFSPSPVSFSYLLVFFVGSIFTIAKAGIRNIFSVDKKTMMLTIGITGILSALFMLIVS